MRALLSVYDKTGLIELANGLVAAGAELVASGGTARALSDAGIVHLEVAEVTQAPEMLGGRVKTLHPVIAGGILADRSNPEHVADLAAREITPIDLVVCNLYPFAAEPSIEMIDIGGPTMVRAAAKNHAHVAVVVDPADYPAVLGELQDGGISARTRRVLARKAFAHVATYDAMIVHWFDEAEPDVLPDTIHLALERAGELLRYGENPHQRGARYRSVTAPRGFWDGVVQHGGRDLSYLNLFDGEAAWRLCHELLDLNKSHAAVIVKHANPCGVAIDDDLAAAYARAFSSDPISAFGGIVALSGHIDAELGAQICANPLADVLIATSVAPEALELFAQKRKNMRCLVAAAPSPVGLGMRQVDGGFLVQDPDRFVARREDWRVVTELAPSESAWGDVELAWRVCARTSSNAIVLANGGQIVGVGCGQQNRVDAAGLAARKADGRATGGVGASDAFFPFRDGLDAVCDAGVGVVIAPGGSLNDQAVIDAANERGVAMIFTGERHFKH